MEQVFAFEVMPAFQFIFVALLSLAIIFLVIIIIIIVGSLVKRLWTKMRTAWLAQVSLLRNTKYTCQFST